MAKWIKKVSTVRLDERAKVIDSLASDSVKHAPSIHAVNAALDDKADADVVWTSDNLTFALSGTTLNITTS